MTACPVLQACALLIISHISLSIITFKIQFPTTLSYLLKNKIKKENEKVKFLKHYTYAEPTLHRCAQPLCISYTMWEIQKIREYYYYKTTDCLPLLLGNHVCFHPCFNLLLFQFLKVQRLLEKNYSKKKNYLMNVLVCFLPGHLLEKKPPCTNTLSSTNYRKWRIQ